MQSARPKNTETSTEPARGAVAPLHVVFFLSGACGLGYEIAWTRQWSVGLGHEVPSMLAVVAAFFGGLAVGAFLLDGPVSRSRRPGRWYVGLELVMGLWALATVWVVPWGNELVGRWTGVLPSAARHWAVAFGVPFLFLLPATAAMGATLPAMDRFFSRFRRSGRSVGGLYAVNTLGAVAGTLGAAFVLVPALGLTGTIVAFAAVNFLCGAVVALGYGAREDGRPAVLHELERVPARARLLGTLFGTGLLGIGYEVLGVRVIAQVLENTVYSFACALAVYLVGTAAGAALYQRFARGVPFDRLLTILLHATGLACLGGVFVMARALAVYEAVAARAASGFGVAVAAELTLAAAVFLLPAALMGATFAHLAQGARGRAGGVGAALAANTLGGAAAPLLFGVVLLPAIGPKWALVAAALGYAVLVPGKTPARLLPAAAALLIVPLLPPHLRLVRPLPGGSVVEHRDGVMASVAVVSDAAGQRYLKVNDRFHMGGSGGGFAARRSAHLPLLLHPDPRSALFLGLGAGTTFHASAWHPELRSRCVELVPEVVELRPHFLTDQERFDPLRQSVIAADARRYVRATGEEYDVIVADLFHPARDGSGSLYTREHFRAIHGRLASGGLFCQWLPLYQLEPETLRIIVRTFLDVFEHAQGYLSDFNVEQPVLGLVGRRESFTHRADWYARRVSDGELSAALERAALRNGYQVLGCLVADRAALAELAGEGPLNLDDRPRVAYLAPHVVYARARPAEENLRALVGGPGPEASALIDAGDPDRAEAVGRLQAYWAARDHYLLGELAETPEERLEASIASLRASPDFAAGYHVLLQEIEQVAGERPDLARALLDVLVESHPHRPEARAVRRRRFGY